MTLGKLTVPFGIGIPTNDWEDADANYQYWETSQEWQQSTSWFAQELSRSSSLEPKGKLTREFSCRVSGQEDDIAQLFVEDVTGHSSLAQRQKTSVTWPKIRLTLFLILDALNLWALDMR